MATDTLEERVALLEREVLTLKRQLPGPAPYPGGNRSAACLPTSRHSTRRPSWAVSIARRSVQTTDEDAGVSA